ncbi:MAG: hypothetical protein GEU98_26805 [Pseudonocardiaceae bacterium]|nr:hypothetical protein [Pseudonocardiaceae bacterium]
MDEWINDVREPDGLIRRDKALRAGVDPDQIMKALRTGRLRRLQRGIYVVRLDDIRPLALARAAVLASGVPDAVASHHTAARVHEIPLPHGTGPEHVTVCRGQRRVQRKELVHHGRSMALGDVEVREHVPLTTPARTLVDLAGVLPELPAVWAIDDTLRRGEVQRSTLSAVLDGRPRSPGDAVAAGRILAADGHSESILETAGRLALGSAGVPLPVPQYQVVLDGAVLARLDGAYPDRRVGLEFAGVDTHGAPRAMYRDRWGHNRLFELGWTVLCFTWWDVMHGREHFVNAVRAALRTAA